MPAVHNFSHPPCALEIIKVSKSIKYHGCAYNHTKQVVSRYHAKSNTIILNLTSTARQERTFGTFTIWHHAHAIICSCSNMSLSNAIVTFGAIWYCGLSMRFNVFSVNHLLGHAYGAREFVDKYMDHTWAIKDVLSIFVLMKTSNGLYEIIDEQYGGTSENDGNCPPFDRILYRKRKSYKLCRAWKAHRQRSVRPWCQWNDAALLAASQCSRGGLAKIWNAVERLLGVQKSETGTRRIYCIQRQLEKINYRHVDKIYNTTSPNISLLNSPTTVLNVFQKCNKTSKIW